MKKLLLALFATCCIGAATAGAMQYTQASAATQQTFSLSVSAVNAASDELNPYYVVRVLFDEQLIPAEAYETEADLQQGSSGIGDKVFLNGYSVNQINREAAFGEDVVRLYWEANDISGGRGMFRMDILKRDFGHPAHPHLAGEFLVEFAEGISTPTGGVLPQMAITPSPDNNDITPDYIALSSQAGEATGAATIKSISPTQVPDSENYAFNVYFNETCASQTLVNQWNNLYITEKVRINGKTISEIKAESVNSDGNYFADAVDLHWFNDSKDPSGRLSIYVKRDIVNEWGFQFDDNDTLEFLAGFRTPTNLELKETVKYTYISKFGVWQKVEEEDDGYHFQGKQAGEYILAEVAFPFGKVLPASVAAEHFLWNGNPLQGTKVSVVTHGGIRYLSVQIPETELSASGEDKLTIKSTLPLQSGSVGENVALPLQLTPNSTLRMSVFDFYKDSACVIPVNAYGKTLKVFYGETELTSAEYQWNGETLSFATDYLKTLPLGIQSFAFTTANGSLIFPVRLKNSQAEMVGETAYTHYDRSDKDLQVYFNANDAGDIVSVRVGENALHGRQIQQNGLGFLIDGEYLCTLTQGQYTVTVQTETNAVEFTLTVADGRPKVTKLSDDGMGLQVNTKDADILSVKVDGKELTIKEYTFEEGLLTFASALTSGKHIVEIATEYGSTECEITVTESSGCGATLSSVVGLPVLALCGVALMKKKKIK